MMRTEDASFVGFYVPDSGRRPNWQMSVSARYKPRIFGGNLLSTMGAKLT